MSFRTSRWLLLQNEHFSPSPSAFFRDIPAPSGSLVDDVVDEAVLEPLGRGHDVVAVRVPLELVERLAGMALQDGVQRLAHPQDLAGVDLDLGRLPLDPAERLVDQD